MGDFVFLGSLGIFFGRNNSFSSSPDNCLNLFSVLVRK